MKEKIQIEFYETKNDLGYELMTVIKKGEIELGAIPCVKNDKEAIRKIGKNISNILESKGYDNENLQITINPNNLNGRNRELSNLSVPEILRNSLEGLNYLTRIH